jgi:dihydrofolate reductase
MAKVVVRNYAISVDGFAAGQDQTIDTPLGLRGIELMEWVFPTKTFRKMQGKDDGEMGIDERFTAESMSGNGAWILGRNMFGPVRGPWPDENWRGWWGDEPPYHVPAFVLTHYPRKPLEMKGGTTFHFVTDGIHAALERARDAAGDLNVRIGGGAETVRQYLLAGLVDEMHLALSPVLMGSGEPLFRDIDLHELGYRCTGSTAGERATHILIERA